MSDKNTAVFGIYSTYAGVQSGADALKAAGFRVADVAALVPENQGSKDFAHEKHTKAPEGFMAGAIIGGIIGGILAGLINTGVIQITGTGPIGSAGLVVAVLAGIGALGILGAIIGGFTGLGKPKFEAKRYQGRIKRGGLLLSVHCDSGKWRDQAKKILKQTGAENISSAPESGADYAEADRPMPRATTGGSPEL
ncbi:MAG: quinol:electron acceptor oxidoreductase subunit ActD [Terriglobia bacterium]